MNREEKAGQVSEVRDKFKSAKMAIVTEYRGLTVSQMAQLRREVFEASGVRSPCRSGWKISTQRNRSGSVTRRPSTRPTCFGCPPVTSYGSVCLWHVGAYRESGNEFGCSS